MAKINFRPAARSGYQSNPNPRRAAFRNTQPIAPAEGGAPQQAASVSVSQGTVDKLAYAGDKLVTFGSNLLSTAGGIALADKIRLRNGG